MNGISYFKKSSPKLRGREFRAYERYMKKTRYSYLLMIKPITTVADKTKIIAKQTKSNLEYFFICGDSIKNFIKLL